MSTRSPAMAEDLYEWYAGLIDQQVNLAEEAVIGVVRAAFCDFSSDFKRHLRSLVPPRRRPPTTSVVSSSSQQPFTRVEVIDSARTSAQCQIATALANRFGALAKFPSALAVSANHPTISGSSNHATAGAIEAINNVTTPNVNPNNDNVSVKSENESECDSSDSESSDGEEEYELTVREIKEEVDDALSNDQMIGNSANENDGMQMMEAEQEENETQSIDNPNDYNFEMTVHSQLVNSNETNSEQQSDGMMIDDDEVNNNDEEGDDGPTIIVVNYEEFETQSIGSQNKQDTVAEGSSNEESVNIAQPVGDFVEITGLNENDSEQSAAAVMTQTSSEQVQSGPSIVSNTASTLPRHLARASSAKRGNYSEVIENSLTEQQDTMQPETRKDKRSIGRSAKSNAPKRTRIGPAPTTVAAAERDYNSEDGVLNNPGQDTISLSVRRLNCRVPGCKKMFLSKVQLDEHLLVKHAIEKYACKVKDCTESYATWDELTIHRNDAHDNLGDWPCGQCEVTCKTYHQLVTHTYHYHENGNVQTHQRKHRCTYAGCTSSFKLKSHLTRHFLVHSKEKPFLCSQCHKAFARKDILTRHERVHSGLKPYSCTWLHCDFSASQQSDVIEHIRGVHFGLPETMKEQREKGIIDHRDARLFVKKSNSTAGN